MEKDTEITQEPTKNPNFDERGKFKEGNEIGKLGGRPSGSLDFKTKWNIFIDKVAKQNNMTPNEIDEQLLAVGFKKAKEGDYAFYRDIHDRVYGKPLQKQELSGVDGNPIESIHKIEWEVIPSKRLEDEK